MTATLRIPWVIDAAGTWMRAETAPVGQPLFCPLCNQPVILKRGARRRWHAAHASGNACASDGETYLHRLAKHRIASHIAAWRDGQAAAPVVQMPCLGCDVVHPVPLPDVLGAWYRPIRHAHDEYRLVDGWIADIALCDADDTPVVLIEVCMTHPVPPDKAHGLTSHGIPWLELDARAWAHDLTPPWSVRNGWLPPWICAACAHAWVTFRAAADALATRWNLTVPVGPPYRYGITRCWKCQTPMIVVTWPTEPPSLPSALPTAPIPPLRSFGGLRQPWWGQPCPTCGALQLWYHRYQAPNAPFRPLRSPSSVSAGTVDASTAWLRDMLRIAQWWHWQHTPHRRDQKQ